ncbi:MAG: FtsH protease activity modulator HflK [Deltaproteobacteria bacterium]|nr:FtsH protease activity modulator HflK [Deltaproteobacteria bacterium]
MNSKTNRLSDTLKTSLSKVASFSRQIAVCLILFYFCSGIYSISSNEVGILQRFGRVIESGIQPGIHFALPWPIDSVIKVPIRVVNRILIDDFSSEKTEKNSASSAFSEMTGLDSYCLTGDNNLINIMCVVQYNIIDPVKYIFYVSNPDDILKNMACNTIVHCLAGMSIDEVLTSGKQGMVYNIKKDLQKRLDDTDSGMGVSFIEISSINPPERVQDDFSDVVRANIDREKMINDAEAYRNEKIPAANADAARIMEEAEAYGKEVVLKAEGDTERFLNLLEQASIKDNSVRKMLYIETMTEIMKNVGIKKIVVSDEKKDAPAHLIINSSDK